MTPSDEIDALISSVLDKDIIQFKKKHAKLFNIVRTYLQNDKYMLYGGMAINYVLPKQSQFYDMQDIPDYDVFCKNAQKSAFELTTKLYDAGYTYAEAKPAMHYGTYKVYANFIPVVDFTEISQTMYNHLFKQAVFAKSIKMWCAPVHYLRMSMYLELSRPKGDISRWSKVYQRLLLLNNAYPITEQKTLYNECNKPMTNKVSEQKTLSYQESMKPLLRKILNKCIKQKYVFIGNACLHILSRSQYKSGKLILSDKQNVLRNKEMQNIHINPKVTYMDVLVNGDLKKNVLCMKRFIEQNSAHKVRIQRHNSISKGEFLPERYTLYIKNKAIMCMYSTFACHGYYTIKGKGMRIASIHTLLNIYFAALLTKKNEHMHCRLFNMIQYVMDVEKRKKFPIVYLGKCYGYQKTMYDMKKSYALKKETKKLKKMKTYRPRMGKVYSRKTIRSKVNTKTTKGFMQIMKNMNPFSKLL